MSQSADRYELHVLGVPDLRAPDGRRVTSVLSQPSRLSLLAYLALAPAPVSRTTVVADFWPESDEARARNALSQALFYLRRSMGEGVVQSVEGDRLQVPPDRLWCDARELLTADRPADEVLRDADDDLLAGWNAEGSQPLQEWLDALRGRVRARAEELRAEGEGHARPADGVGVKLAAGSSATSSPSPASLAPHRRGFWAPATGVAALVALAFAVLLPLVGAPAEGTGAAGVDARQERLAVLLPRVTPAAAGAPELDPLTLHAEILARLLRRPGLVVVPAGFASSLGELLGWRERVDASTADPPEWVLEVLVVVADDAVHVVTLVHRGEGLATPGADSFDQPFASPDAVAVDVPRAIAERVSRTVADVIGG